MPLGFAYLGDGRLSALQLLSIFTLEGWFRMVKKACLLNTHDALRPAYLTACIALLGYLGIFGHFQCLYMITKVLCRRA